MAKDNSGLLSKTESAALWVKIFIAGIPRWQGVRSCLTWSRTRSLYLDYFRAYFHSSNCRPWASEVERLVDFIVGHAYHAPRLRGEVPPP